jgi:hypothetical protein
VRRGIDEGEFPWIIWENLSGVELSDNLKKTLELLCTYAKDLKFTKSSILTLPHAPQFPNLEWINIIIGAMVDLNHVILGPFTVSSDKLTTGMLRLSQGSNSSLELQEQVSMSRYLETSSSD